MQLIFVRNGKAEVVESSEKRAATLWLDFLIGPDEEEENDRQFDEDNTHKRIYHSSCRADYSQYGRQDVQETGGTGGYTTLRSGN